MKTATKVLIVINLVWTATSIFLIWIKTLLYYSTFRFLKVNSKSYIKDKYYFDDKKIIEVKNVKKEGISEEKIFKLIKSFKSGYLRYSSYRIYNC